jgi:glycosyltransferase involved in cell wall biosynthesis
MKKVSVIIPARNELYLKQTVCDLLAKATGEIEVIVILDGYWPIEALPDDPRLIIVHRERRGMRASINAGIAVSKGEYIMKIDAHCLIAEGYDETLKADCDKDWIVIPRRYALDAETWSVRRHRAFVDYEYLSWPYRAKMKGKSNELGLHGWTWDERIISRINRLIDETMTFQGSCWFMPKEFFQRRIVQMDETGYGSFIGEAQELGLKAWLGGGQVMVNKKTWYAHLWKGEPYRNAYKEVIGQTYSRVGRSERDNGNRFSIDHWLNDRWEGRIHDFEWLIKRFAPIPSWPADKSAWLKMRA